MPTPATQRGSTIWCDTKASRGRAILDASRSFHIAVARPATRFRDLEMLPWPRLRNRQPASDQLHHAAWSESLILGVSKEALLMRPCGVTLRVSFAPSVQRLSAFDLYVSRAARLVEGCTLRAVVHYRSRWTWIQLRS